jgi:hypothetical protein
MRDEMTSKSEPGNFLGLLRAAALIAVPAGAAGSVGFMLRVGHRNSSRVLLLLFGIWVLSPFVALVLAHVVSKRWSVLTRAAIYGLMLAITVGSLSIYGAVALGPPRPKPAFVFVLVPRASWLLIAIVVAIAALRQARSNVRSNQEGVGSL